MTRIWNKYLDPRDTKVYSGANMGVEYGLGEKAALLIIDVLYGFTGDKPEPIEESIKTYPFSCGAESWDSIRSMQQLLSVAREQKLPIYYTTMEGSRTNSNAKLGVKGNNFDHPMMLEGEKGTKVVQDLAPLAAEVEIDKKKPSAFFGTPLLSYLIDNNVDTVIVAGTTTSGCIRASVVDAFSYNFKVIVPEECVFDRGITTHAMNLFDMHQKYADVLPTEEVITRLKK